MAKTTVMRRKFFPGCCIVPFCCCIVLIGCKGKDASAVFVLPGGEMTVRLELARTPEEKRKGLMFRDRIEERRGMLFCYEIDEKPVFWMKNTYLSLDMIFLSGSGEIVDFLERLPPCPMDPCPAYRPRTAVRYAMEVRAGFVAEHQLRRGDRVQLNLTGSTESGSRVGDQDP